MEKYLLVINKENANAVAGILEKEAFTLGLNCPNKGCVNVLDSLYNILDPKRHKDLNRSCGLGTCASPLWTCNTCSFANKRPFGENLKFEAKVHYRKEMEMKIWYERYLGIRE